MLVLYRVGAPLHATLGRCPVAVAGTRNPTPKGRELARELGRILAETGYTVVTGLARGVDEEATLGALEIGGRVVAVLPYLFETDGKFNPRAAWLLRVATSRNATVSVVSENPVKDDNRVRTWFAMRNRIITRLATALVVPETKFKLARWGTRHAVEHALAMRRLVVVFEPRVRDGDVVKAYEQFRRIATAVRDVAETVDTVRRQCRHGAAR